MPYLFIKPPRMDWDDHSERTQGQTVIVEDDAPTDTKLVTPDGDKIYRTSDRIPAGFRK